MKRRAEKSVGFFAYETPHTRAPHRGLVSQKRSEGGFSQISVTAGLAVLLVVVVLTWTVARALMGSGATPVFADAGSGALGSSQGATAAATGTTSAATSSDPISDIGSIVMDQLQGAYLDMQQSGTYSTSSAQQAAESLAPYVTADVQYPTFAAADIKTDSNTSYARMLQYRTDLRASLSPLLNNTQPEYEIFAYYVDTKDTSYLTKLQTIAGDYRAAASSTAHVVAPVDAKDRHVAILNAMEEFAATLDAMASHADDPFASVALLRTYDKAEADMLTSFNDLTAYYKSKTP